jgi:hypothetical protein
MENELQAVVRWYCSEIEGQKNVKRETFLHFISFFLSEFSENELEK